MRGEPKKRKKKTIGERVRRKKMHLREEVAILQTMSFFRGFVAPEGRQVGQLRRVRFVWQAQGSVHLAKLAKNEQNTKAL